MKTSYGQKMVPFGIGKLKIVETIGLCIKINADKLNQRILETHIILAIFVILYIFHYL